MRGITIIFDGNGEPDPYKFDTQWFDKYATAKGIQFAVQKRRLTVGDYTIDGFETCFVVERKKLNDFTNRLVGSSASKGPDQRDKRKEFYDRQVQPMSLLPDSAFVIESSWNDIIWQNYRSKITPNSVIGSVTSIIADYKVPILFAGDRAGGETATFQLLLKWFLKHSS